jgi:hypothetical protein
MEFPEEKNCSRRQQCRYQRQQYVCRKSGMLSSTTGMLSPENAMSSYTIEILDIYDAAKNVKTEER